MQLFRSNGDRVPDHILEMAEDAKAGKVDRREFLALASVFGASTAMAHGMLGLAAPTQALAQEGKKGGVLKMEMDIREMKDPSDLGLVRNAERPAPVQRLHGPLHDRLHFRGPPHRELGHQRRCDGVHAARSQGCEVVERRRFQRRRRRLQPPALVRQIGRRQFDAWPPGDADRRHDQQAGRRRRYQGRRSHG